jgi:hypothetical protein
MQVDAVLISLGVGSASGLVVGVCVFFLARTYFGSYLNEKAKNLASKEDIAEITRLVEDVKFRFSTDLEDHRTNNQLRMAALDRRLQAHQEAFSLWRRLLFSVHSEHVGRIVAECQEWWTNNCLYLEAEARDAFNTAFFNAHHHASLLQSGDVKLIKENFDAIRKTGDVLLKAAQLPGFTAGEKRELAQLAADNAASTRSDA